MEILSFVYQNNGELWLCVLGYYIYEFGVMRSLCRTGRDVYQLTDLLESTCYQNIVLQGCFETAHYCKTYPVIPQSYFMRLFSGGVNFERVFTHDLRRFLCVVKGHVTACGFLMSVLSSLVLVAVLLWIVSSLLGTSDWNFHGMILMMLCVQVVYMSYVKIRLVSYLSGSDLGFQDQLSQGVRLITGDGSVVIEQLQKYWHHRTGDHRYEVTSAMATSHEEMASVSDEFLNFNTLRQVTSLLNVTQAVGMIFVFFIQNF